MTGLAIAIVLLARILPAAARSDLTPEIYDVHFDGPGAWVDPSEVAEGCAQSSVGRTLLRFGTRVTNLGPDALVIGDPGCPDCSTNPGAACKDDRFVCSAALGRPHFRTAARYELFDPTGVRVLTGSKRGYCFIDDYCANGSALVYTDCGAGQGLSVGCTDDYDPSVYCQYLDVTDVPDVMTRTFRLRVTIDTADLLPDPNRSNNVAEVVVPGCRDADVRPSVQCAVNQVSVATVPLTCPHRTAVRLARGIERTHVIAARLVGARAGSARSLTARLLRLTNQTIRLTGGARCGSAELASALQTLHDQLIATQAY